MFRRYNPYPERCIFKSLGHIPKALKHRLEVSDNKGPSKLLEKRLLKDKHSLFVGEGNHMDADKGDRWIV